MINTQVIQVIVSQVKSSPESLTSKSESSLKYFIFCQVKSQVIKIATRVDSSPSHQVTSPHLCIEELHKLQEKEGLRLGNKLKMAHIQW